MPIGASGEAGIGRGEIGGDEPIVGKDSSRLLDVGRVVKPHGLVGEVVVDLWSDLPTRLIGGAVFSTDHGVLSVTRSRPHAGKYLVFFDGVVDRVASEALRGVMLRAEPVEVEDALWVDDLLGAQVVTLEGCRLGEVTAVEANPASDLLVVDGKGLVPLRFMVHHDPGVTVTVDIPEGLLD